MIRVSRLRRKLSTFFLKPLPLGRQEGVHVWQCLLSSMSMADRDGTLSLDELQRANQFHFPEDREHFVKCHGLLRSILNLYTKTDPSEITFGRGACGKPFITGSFLKFNLSHSKDRMLCAVTMRCEVGVDIEYIQPSFDWKPVARIFFTAAEIQTIKSFPENFQVQTFFRIWTRKEALAKALGIGLSQKMPTEEESSQWVVRNLSGMKDYAAAIAYEKTNPQ